MSKTPHCVCSPNSAVISSPLKHQRNEMPSPPLPPRTLRANKSPIKTKWEQLPDKANCLNDKLQCSCNRPQSCPADDGSPPIPPKCSAQAFNKSKYQIDKRFDDPNQKLDTKPHKSHRTSRKSGRHTSSDGDKLRKKSRSKSRPLGQDEKRQGVRTCEDERYFMKNHDNLIDRNCEIFYKTNKEFVNGNVNVKFSNLTDNNETSGKLCSKTIENMGNFVPQPIHPPDLIPNRSNSTKVGVQSTTDNSQKSASKSRLKKFFSFWLKSKKLGTETTDRATTITPDTLPSLQTTDDIATRPRRSKSLHLISSLSPNTSVHAKNHNEAASSDIKTKNSSLFAVISPDTTRRKRNLLCISPKASGSSSGGHKKQADTLPMTGNVKSVLSDNSQLRPELSSTTNVRLSPVHLIASNTNNESCCLVDYNNSNLKQNHYNVQHFNCGNTGDNCRGPKFRSDHQEKGNFNEMEAVNKTSSELKFHNHSHQDANQRKTPLSTNQISRQPLINNSVNQMCSCYHHPYRPNTDNNTCSCNNNAYHHFCPSQPAGPSCGCMHNIVQFNPNHFHCCHGNQQLWCLVPCCPDQIQASKQHSFCSGQIYHHHQSASPPANFSTRQLPPPVPSFSNNHQFSRRYRQSYSKTPPPSFNTHQRQCHEDDCYQEYSLNQMPDSRQKMILAHQLKSNTCHVNCCTGFQNKQQCSLFNHSKCSACGSLFYDELGSQATHYNISEMHNNHCSTTPMSDSVFEQTVMPKNRMFTSPINMDESFNCRSLYNHNTHRHSETCGRHSNETRIHSCRNSAHRSLIQPHVAADKERSSSKRRKNSSHSFHGSNLDNPESEDKHDSSRTHHNSPATNMLPSTSVHMSPELNINNINCDMSLSANNSSILPNSINTLITSSATIIQNDRQQQIFEPWRKTFIDNMLALRNLGWYWGPLNHLEAEYLVQDRHDGTFLVRDSGNEAYFLSLTFRVLGTTYHTRIEYSQGKFSFWSQPESHSATTIVEFIDKAVAHSVSGKFHYFLQTNTPGQPPMEVSLLHPLSRYQIVQSLQHLSRFVILSNIRRDHVIQLELPQSIKSYLIEKQYYIDNIETFVNITKKSEPLTYEPSGRTL